MTHIERFKACGEIVQAYNKPNCPVVAMNCSQIGDDNDFSLWLIVPVFALIDAGWIETAVNLANIDPLGPTEPWTEETLKARYDAAKAWEKKRSQETADAYKFYLKD